MAPGRRDGLIRLHLSPEFCARGGPCRHTRRLQIVWRPPALWIAPPTVRRIGGLQLTRERQYCAEPLILDDRAGRHRLDLVEHPDWILSNTRNGRATPSCRTAKRPSG